MTIRYVLFLFGALLLFQSASFGQEVKGRKKRKKEIQIEDTFVRVIPSRTDVNLSDTLMLTYKLYSIVNIRNIPHYNLPSIRRDFVENNLTAYRQSIVKEELDGHTYNTVIFRRVVLKPRELGVKTIPQGSIVVELEHPTGKRIQDFWGDEYEEVEVEKKELKVDSVTIKVFNLIEV